MNPACPFHGYEYEGKDTNHAVQYGEHMECQLCGRRWPVGVQMPDADEIRRLAAAQPTTEFERVAKSIMVEAESHNGGCWRDVDLFEVLKYPTAFYLPSLKVKEAS